MQGKMCLKEGSFCITRGKAFVDYMIKIGIKPEDAKKAEGSHWMVCISKACEKSWQVVLRCKECPEMNFVQCYNEGEETCVDSPISGPTKITITSADETTFKMTNKCEKFGLTETTQVFTDQGMTMSVKNHKSGATMTENWSRWVNEEGTFRYVCNENGAEYLKGTGCNDDFDKMMKGAGIRQTKLAGEDTWEISEKIGGKVNTMTVKFDEECDYNVPGWERKMLMTRLAPGKVKCIMKNPKDGRVEEWTRWMTPCGRYAIWCGEDKKTGNKCKIVYEKFSCPVGTWRPISISGGECVAKACGMPDQLAKDLANDLDHRVIVKMSGDYMHMTNTSKYTPVSLIYKMNEEFEFSFPGCDEKIKAIETVCGDTYTLIEKTSKWCVKNVSKVTNNFMVIDTHVMGTSARSKYIYTRCCDKKP